MPRIVSSTEYDRVIAEIAKHPAGIGVDGLHAALIGKPARGRL
jgi:hypothetical protein